MSMRPLDMQVIVPKMTEVARVHNSESSRQLLTAQQGAESTKAMVDADLREVRTKKDAQNVAARVKRGNEEEKRRDRRRGGGGNGGGQGSGAAGGDAKGGGESGAGGAGRAASIDIRL